MKVDFDEDELDELELEELDEDFVFLGPAVEMDSVEFFL